VSQVRDLTDERAAAPPAATALGEVAGESPGTTLKLLSLRRTGPKVVTAQLQISLASDADGSWFPALVEDGLSAENMRLVDETNGREHFVLRDADGACLCSGAFADLDEGESTVVTAKFPAPPEDVTHASLRTPGFASFDRIPLS
jgi:hypothetical protein